MNQSNFTVIIPSKKIDENLLNCESKIRSFYNDIKIILLVDKEDDRNSFSKNTYIINTGEVNVSSKRNIGIEISDSEYLVFIDSDAYPDHPWLDNAENNFSTNKNIGAFGGPNLSPNSELEEKKFVSAIKKSFVVSQNANYLKNKQSKSRLIDFLPTCNLIVKRSALGKGDAMDNRLFAHEDISLNQKIIKNGYKILIDPSAYIFHKDRTIKSFLRQRFIYGTEAFNVFLKYPCIASFKLFISTFASITLVSFILLKIIQKLFLFEGGAVLILISNFLLLAIFLTLFLAIFESVKVFSFYKKDFIKILIIISLSIYLPGLGQILRPLLKWKLRRKIWIQ